MTAVRTRPPGDLLCRTNVRTYILGAGQVKSIALMNRRTSLEERDMSFRFGSRVINRIGIVGSGQIGPDIALHLAKALYREKVPVTVVDISPDALARGRAKLEPVSYTHLRAH